MTERAPTSRPHCLKPDGCAAKGAGHCRTCGGKLNMARFNANRELVARRLELAALGRSTEEHRLLLRKRMKKLLKRQSFRQASAAAAACTAMHLSADPGIIAKRARSQKITKARTCAERWHLPIGLVEEFRRLRAMRVPPAEARSILERSEPRAFAAMEEAQAAREAELAAAARARKVRAPGPQPVPGDEERANWIRQKHGEARP